MLKSFRIGGIHPPENKLSAGKNIQTAALPKQAVILLGQHIGAPAQVVVNKGDSVKVGTLLAKAGGFVSANGVRTGAEAEIMPLRFCLFLYERSAFSLLPFVSF